MSGGRLGRIVLVTAAAAGTAAVIAKLRGPAAPQFSNHPSVSGGPAFGGEEPSALIETAPPAEVIEAVEVVEVAATWVEPVDGACPEGYPIKAKLSSGIFHQPGGLAYERTKPDRCYPDAASAEADGLRAAKR